MEEGIKMAVRYTWSYGQIDGDYHKMWVIDQMVRTLLGKEEYEKWVERYETPEGENYWKWNTGIAP